MTGLHERLLALPPDKRAELERRLQADAARTHRVSAITARPDPDAPVELSASQRRVWFMHQVRPPFTPPSVVDLDGELDVGALETAFTALVARHEALRTVVMVRNDTPLQHVLPAGPVPLPVTDLHGVDRDQQDELISQAVTEETHRPFDLSADVMLRVRLFRRSPDCHLLLLTTHHLSMDGWSFGILVRELGVLYAAAHTGNPSPLTPLPIQYADFAAWQHTHLTGAQLDRHLAYWREHLGSEPPHLELPTDRARPSGQARAGNSLDRPFPADVARRIKILADTESATPFMATVAGVAALLHRSTGQTDLVLGSTTANRTRPETESLIANFVNTLALRVDVSGDPTFRELLGRVRTVTLGAVEHQELPFERLVRELAPERNTSHSPIAQMVINYDNTPQFDLDNNGLRLRLRPVRMDVVHFDLTLSVLVDPDTDDMTTTWEYNSDIFEEATVARLSARWQHVIAQAVADPDLRISDLDLLTDDDLTDLADLNARARDIPATPVHELIARQAAHAPDADAVTLAEETLSHAELDRRANQLAHHLRDHGVLPGTLVGICTDRCLELAVAILGVLKAGGAYVPLDPSYPVERLTLLLDDSAPQVLLTQEHLRSRTATYPGAVVTLDTGWSSIAAHPDTAPPPAAGPDDPAYVIYTSGSTGRPKGVRVNHRALTGYTLAAIDAFAMGPRDRMLQFASPGFDVLVEELFPTWLAGAAVVMVSEHRLAGGAQLTRLVRDERITAVELPTSYWHEWAQAIADSPAVALPDHLRLVIVGGERVLPERLRDWQRGGVPLTHVFGLTETTVTTTTYRLPEHAGDDILQNLPIGRPLTNMTVHVLDDRMRPMPIGLRGELYIGGVGVAQGYLNRPELTEQRFVPDPATPGARLYRTGDIVRVRHDHELEFIGRIDTQVKIRGHRIEPAEVEATLAEHPDVQHVVVIAREDTPGDRRLVAYVVLVPDTHLDVTGLRRFLEPRLPAPYIPSAFLALNALPTTAHGKLDRSALPSPDGSRPEVESRYIAPDGAVETTLASIWAEVIGIDTVGAHDNFFEVGGDSILGIQVVTRAVAAGLRLTPTDLFMYPTVAQLAAHATTTAETDTGTSTAIAPGPETGPFPLSPLQRWFFAQNLPAPHHWNMSSVLLVHDRLETSLLQPALDALLAHHAALRQRFTIEADGAVSGVIADLDHDERFPLEVHDLSPLAPPEQTSRFALLADDLQTRLDLHHGPLVRAALVRLSDRAPDRLVITAHHLVVDAVSLRILIEDFVAVCAALHAGHPPALPPAATSFIGWAQWMDDFSRSTDLIAQLSHWQTVLSAEVQPLPRRQHGHNVVADVDQVTTIIDPQHTDLLLRTTPGVYRARIDEVLLAGLAIALTRWDGEPRHLVEMEGHGRQTASGIDLSRTVGWFTAAYPVLLDGTDDDPDQVIRRTKEHVRAVPTGGVGYQALRQRGTLTRPAVEPEIAFSYFGQLDRVIDPDSPLVPATESPGRTEDPTGRRPHLLEISGEIGDGQLRLACRFASSLHPPQDIHALMEAFATALTAIIDRGRGDKGPGLGLGPSDFPQARLSQASLDTLLDQLSSAPGDRK